MFKNAIDKITISAIARVELLNISKIKYILSSILAGVYVGFGVLLSFTIGALLSNDNSSSTRIVMGVSFGIALSLVIMAGSELFTGNNLIMTIGSLQKKVSWVDTYKIWIYSYLGNLFGSIILALIFVLSGLAKGNVGDFFIKVASIKMTPPFLELFMRGILCNILVCLAIWCSFKLQEEISKLIMIFWCLFAFITIGFEHSIANMTIFSTAMLIPHNVSVTIGGFMYNIVVVTLGNMIGGIFFIGYTYWFIAKER